MSPLPEEQGLVPAPAPRCRAGIKCGREDPTEAEVMSTGIIDEIVAAGRLDAPWTWEPTQQFYDGRLHLTRAQWERVLDIYPPGRRHCWAVWGIPVKIREECRRCGHLHRLENGDYARCPVCPDWCWVTVPD
jgi:hypothetical protein